MNTKVIVFDLGRVLVDFDHGIAAQRVACFCDKSPEEIFDFFFSSNLTSLFEEGKISPEDFFLQVKDALGLSLSYETFVPIWNDIFFLSPKNRTVYSVINKLRKRYKVALLTNINILHYEYLKKHFPVFDVFHAVLASCELGFVKPNKAIYKKTLELLEASAECVIYIDDRRELIDSAKELGIKGIQFISAEQLTKELLDLKVDIS